MKKKIFPLIRGVVHGSGNIVTETRNVTGFNKVQLDGTGTLTIIKGDSESVQIEADDNVLPELTSDGTGNTLVLGIEENGLQKAVIPTQTINYVLSVTDLSDITINGGGSLSYYGYPTISQDISGAGKIDSLGEK